MLLRLFDSRIEETDAELFGPWRAPRQMLKAQSYDSHASIHDDATAQKLGFQRGTIEGPTHFSQFVPLCVEHWGIDWFRTGCISAHFRNAVFEGEKVRANMVKPLDEPSQARIAMIKDDGTEVLQGTASVGTNPPRTALEQRLAGLNPLTDAVILRDVKCGMKTARQRVRMAFDQNMGELYPFSLREKLQVITENSPLYTSTLDNPFSRPIIPMEMLSVLFQYRSREERLPSRGPAVSLFADQEIRLLNGPLFVDQDYELEREVLVLSGSRRTESLWVRTTVFDPAVGTSPVASMLINHAILKDSYAPYAQEYAELRLKGEGMQERVGSAQLARGSCDRACNCLIKS